MIAMDNKSSLDNNYLNAHSLQCSHSSHLQLFAPQQVGGPHYGHVLGRHPGAVVAERDAVEMSGEILQGPAGQ